MDCSIKKLKYINPARKMTRSVTPLFRDGILWIAIFEGIEAIGTRAFPKTVGGYPVGDG